MAKLAIPILSALLCSTAWANSTTAVAENNAFSAAVSEIAEQAYQPTMGRPITSPSPPYSHEDEKNNSLFRAVLAIQGIKSNILINSSSEVTYSPRSASTEHNNSIFRRALAR